MVFFWKPQNNVKFHALSILVWLLLSCYLAQQFGTLKIAVFTLLMLIIIGGFIFEVMDIHEELHETGNLYLHKIIIVTN